MADEWLSYNGVRLRLTEGPRTRHFPGGLVLLGASGEFACGTPPTRSSLLNLRSLLSAPGNRLALGRQAQTLLEVPAGSPLPRWIDVQPIPGRRSVAVTLEVEFTLPGKGATFATAPEARAG